MWIIEASTSAGLEYLVCGQIDLKQLRESLRTGSRFAGVCVAFVLLYVPAPPLTLIALPFVALVYSEQRIRHLSNRKPTDDKTGLATSATFTDCSNAELHQAERTGAPVSLVLMDLDHFKAINSGFGHLGGDDALAQVADLLINSSRASDLVARWGGDELVWLMPGCPRMAAAGAAESLRAQIAGTTFVLSGQPASLTTSIGVASWSPGISSDDIFSRADKALYRSKEAGRNTCSVDGIMSPVTEPYLTGENPDRGAPREERRSA